MVQAEATVTEAVAELVQDTVPSPLSVQLLVPTAPALPGSNNAPEKRAKATNPIAAILIYL